MGLLAGLSPLLLAAGTPASDQCNPIPGYELALADQAVRWIVIGEIHGTNEIPALFADAVCLTARSRPLIVALEQPASDQGAIDEFIRSDGSVEAKRKFLATPMWNSAFQDGRTSEAYFSLFETLRQMYADRRIISVVAFQPSGLTERPTPAGYEKAMADRLAAAAMDGTTVIALVGNAHAMRTEVPWGDRYLAMAGHLPREATLAFNTVFDGGEVWNCRGQPVICGPSTSPSRGNPRSRGVEVLQDDGPYSGVIYLGTSTTASPPQANPAATPG
jgi:hypothetical protein